jgi:2-haloacid dehalogenase
MTTKHDDKRGETTTLTTKAIVLDAYGTLFDVQSVASVTDEAFPGYGELITQIWRLKQLEYTWLRSLMGRYEDFSVITRDSLVYTLRTLGLAYDDKIFERIMDKYLHLDLYDDARQALADLKDYRLAILSNGSTDMLTALVRNAGLDEILDATISIDSKRIFKPSPDAYALVETRLGFAPAEVVFVSSNPWDAIGAKSFGFKTAWIERVTVPAMIESLRTGDQISPLTMFKALRMQMDELGLAPDYRVHGLSALAGRLVPEGR